MADITSLGKQDPGLRIRGIEAWRSSPLVQTYQSLIADAMREGVPIDVILKDKHRNKLGMTLDEVAVVRSLNQQLRY